MAWNVHGTDSLFFKEKINLLWLINRIILFLKYSGGEKMKKIFVELFEVFPNGLTSNRFETSFSSIEELENYIDESNSISPSEKWHELDSYIDYKILND